MTMYRSATPASLRDEVRTRIAPLFPDWPAERVEDLVAQIADLEWRYSVGNCTSAQQHDT
ncbi:MAG: hypothetical protein M3Z05_10115 [Gemmatimonadota bacterium]|nr:hypothetical protein [Gemmatimonadota bacterium]